MARPDHLDLGAPRNWRPADMPGANHPVDAVRLASATAPFSMLGRFPRGFERQEPGGYRAAEEFIVLRGALWLDGQRAGVGTLVHVGAGRLRQELRAPDGCEVLVWFDGTPDFVTADDFEADGSAELVLIDLGAASLPLQTPAAAWSCGAPGDWPSRADGFSPRGWAATRETWRWPDEELVTWRSVPDVPPGSSSATATGAPR